MFLLFGPVLLFLKICYKNITQKKKKLHTQICALGPILPVKPDNIKNAQNREIKE